MTAVLYISWKGKEFPIEYSSLESLEKMTVEELKRHCSKMTGLDWEKIQLLAFGAIMNSDTMPLSTYGLRSGSQVLLKAKNASSKTTVEREQRAPKESREETLSREEQGLMNQLQTIQHRLETEIEPPFKAYEIEMKQFMTQANPSPKEKEKQIYQATYWGEQLMHLLFQLDSLICGQEFLTARKNRKETVQRAQALLDRVDEMKSLLKSIHV
ncbi:hypothetical protein BY458DRAFT_505917 [Sporodiniella umbellata]|nr:hypothetical protein BY458DRAFT_505917 [Sporodiniella umbellata]